MTIVLNMVCSGPPGKKECKVGNKRQSIRKSFKNPTKGKSYRPVKVTTEKETDSSREVGDGTTTNPNRMYGTQKKMKQPSKKEMKARLKYLKESGNTSGTLNQGS